MTRWLLVIALLSGCGAGALELHARAADATGRVLILAHDSIRDARTEEVRQVREGAPGGPNSPAAEDARDQIDLRYEPITDAYEATLAAHMVWVRVIVHAASGEPWDLNAALSAATEIVALYAELSRMATHAGVNLPEDVGGIVNAAIGAPVEEGP